MFALFPTKEGGHAANPFPKEKGPLKSFKFKLDPTQSDFFTKHL